MNPRTRCARGGEHSPDAPGRCSLGGYHAHEPADAPLPPSHDAAFLAILGLVFAGALALLAVVGAA